MPFQRPSLPELVERGDSQLSSRLGIGPLLRRSVLGGLSRVLAGASHMLHAHISWASNQILPDTSEAEILARQASIYNLTRKASAFASGTADFTFTQASQLPAGTKVRRSDGVEFEVIAGISPVAAGTYSASIRAVASGDSGNTAVGVQLLMISPVAYVNQSASTVSLAGGADEETDERLRARLLKRIQEPPHGGSSQDYVAWALEIPKVTRAWAFPSYTGIGTVGITFTLDEEPGGPIPDGAKVQEVQAFIDLVRPVTAAPTVFAPTPIAMDPVITLTPNTPAVQAAVEAAIADLHRREAIPGGTLLLSHIREAISSAAGETDHVLVSPVADVVVNNGELSVPGVITWQS